MEGCKFCDILFSSYDPNFRTIDNTDLIHDIIASFDPSRFDLTKLNDIFVSFQSSHSISLSYNADHVAKMELDVKYKTPVYFEYGSLTWTGTIIKHKWQNNKYGGEEWFTLSSKLPNDGYVYNKYRFTPNRKPHASTSSQPSTSKPPASLDHRYYNNLKDLISFTLGIFGDRQISTKVFYFVEDGRVNYKVICEELKMWLQITFECGPPKEEVTTDAGWFDREELKKILGEPVAK